MLIYLPTYYSDTRNSGIGLELLNLYFYLTFFSSAVIYYFSKYKQARLLAFNYCLIFLYSIIKITYTIVYFNKVEFHVYEILYILLTLTYIFMSYYFITKFLNSKETTIPDNEDKIIEKHNQNASVNKRLVNLIIDSTLIFIIVFGLISNIERDDFFMTFFMFLRTTFGERSSFIIFFYVIKFIYYLVFESLFKATPAKFLTGSYVNDEDGNSPNFTMILKRTLYRLIPFESFSFLVGRNLHDNDSHTYVVNNRKETRIDKQYLLFLGISVFTLLVIYFYFNNRMF
ncbi:RDD family protein [Flavobacterium sp. MC2016-06]|uniref:RDD family protein n=1 Tax=Flavobacterium sp. MC2016-06 TaxID=2676308 RepID=UPI0018ACBBA0|nr:RDD family protein [Flavobacterium sp. MC2016-06]MBU3861821.1 RDD family protein [Flavobacterium sp. MC2016-06]